MRFQHLDRPNRVRVRVRMGMRMGMGMGCSLVVYSGGDSGRQITLDRVYRMAIVDAGTKLYERRCVNDTLKRSLRQARQLGRPLCVVSDDLDRCKSVNDSHGHAAGDLVLGESAAVVSPIVGQAGIPGRLGGEEFLLLLPDTPLFTGLVLDWRIRAAVAGHGFVLPVGDGESHRSIGHHQTISLGVAEWGNATLDTGDLLDAADRRLYQSKHEGRDRVSG